MAKQYGGVFANWYGRIGNVVGRIRQGRTIMSIYQPNVANPKTSAQLAQREKFTLLAECFKTMSEFLKVTFHNLDGYDTGNYYSAAIGYNMKLNQCFTGSYPNTQIDFTHLQISNGSVALPYSPSASAEGTTLAITWADNSGMGNAETTDKVMICVYNATKNQSVSNTAFAERNDRNGTMTLPSTWTGDTVNVFLAMSRSINDCSPSVHLATLAV